MKSNMTIGQAMKAIALAQIKAMTPHLAAHCKSATILFEDGRFQVRFADGIDNLSC